MPPETTPMMQQYLRMKELHPDCILFFRLGDFYEMFNEDAKLVSKELELTLTSRDRGKPEAQRTPMCGVPYHSADAYIARLIAKGYKVAICEQMEDPALAKGLVDRDIIRIITPGTVMTSSMLEEGRNNFICAVYRDSAGTGLCFCDISTGECSVTSFTGPEADEHLYNELGRFTPREAMLSWTAAARTGARPASGWTRPARRRRSSSPPAWTPCPPGTTPPSRRWAACCPTSMRPRRPTCPTSPP